ncbi:hypothetical protein MRB53_002922 [Persea americana]|uniref:Uncharacterized protein n=1 Tax=Persea americana TaxID=3435 RepID=A0ACC2MW53_PERAE|nr:hypothetical protein MRB53_002922 [Persea americana]
MAEQSPEQFKAQPRLPKFAIPKRYDLKLKPDLSSCKFTGFVQIDLQIASETRFIVLNAADLSFENSSICFTDCQSNKEYRPWEVAFVEEDEILVLQFDDALSPGEGILCIGFSGTLNDQMKGFYRSTYEHNGEKKNMAVTQFESADARRCFPCWDEPAVKATFKITLEVPSELIALSNMPVIQEKVDGHLKIVSFQESPIMSTYLVAVVIDMIAIPDLALGAMENYGLVTYRETTLLYDEKHSAAVNKQRVAIAVAHELAHQWFGNLVTMEWWTDLWLNEGFATWVSHLAVDSFFPEWNIWTQFLDRTTDGLRLDGLAESHPIEVEINHAREIDEIFDAISYKKGASVIRMLQSYLGAECFQRSLASYIRRHACSNARTEDLWAVLGEESGEPVNMLLNPWTKQKGYPVVYVNIKDKKLEFEQTQFLSSGHLGDGQWIVPITLCCGSYDTHKNFLLRTKAEKLDIMEIIDSSNCKARALETNNQGDNNNPNRAWIKINVDQTGFYRVKYDDELTARLKYAIQANCLSATDRFGILDDSYALCMACKQTLSSLFSLMDAYREELNYTVLSQLINVSCKIATIAVDAIPESSDDVKKFFINLLQFSAGKLGWDPKSGESHLDSMLRGEILTALSLFGHDATLTEAVRRFCAFVDDRNASLLPPDLRKAAYVAVMQTVSSSNRPGYESLLRVYRETDMSQEKVRILGSLASCPDPNIVLEVLNFLLTSEVRSQDVVHGLAGISREGREVAWKWLKDHWDHIIKTWGSGFLLTRFVSYIVSPFCSDEKENEVEEFFATHARPSITRTLKQSLEQVRINSRWVQSIRNEKSLGEVVKELTHCRK